MLGKRSYNVTEVPGAILLDKEVGVPPKPRAFSSGARDLARSVDSPTRDSSLRLKNGFVQNDASVLDIPRA